MAFNFSEGPSFQAPLPHLPSKPGRETPPLGGRWAFLQAQARPTFPVSVQTPLAPLHPEAASGARASFSPGLNPPCPRPVPWEMGSCGSPEPGGRGPLCPIRAPTPGSKGVAGQLGCSPQRAPHSPGREGGGLPRGNWGGGSLFHPRNRQAGASGQRRFLVLPKGSQDPMDHPPGPGSAVLGRSPEEPRP